MANPHHRLAGAGRRAHQHTVPAFKGPHAVTWNGSSGRAAAAKSASWGSGDVVMVRAVVIGPESNAPPAGGSIGDGLIVGDRGLCLQRTACLAFRLS